MYTADEAAHVFNGRFYIYPSHDIESGIPENDNGDNFDMLGFAEVPRDVVILDKEGKPLTAGDHDRRFFEASWMASIFTMYFLLILKKCPGSSCSSSWPEKKTNLTLKNRCLAKGSI